MTRAISAVWTFSAWAGAALALPGPVLAQATTQQALAALAGGDAARALALARGPAQAGDAAAQALVGRLMCFEPAFREPGQEAAQWLEKAAGQGQPAARHDLGRTYLEGSCTVQDLQRGLAELQRGVSQGWLPSQQLLARLYAQGQMLPRSLVRAGQLYAGLDHPQALAQLPGLRLELAGFHEMIWELGAGLKPADLNADDRALVTRQAPQSKALAAQGFRRELEAGDLNHADRYIALSDADPDSLRWLDTLARQGYDAAALRLANRAQAERKPSEEIGWLLQAAKNDNPNAVARLALAYDAGHGVRRNLEESKEWLARAAGLDRPPTGRALGLLALKISQAHVSGKGLPKDDESALHWARIAQNLCENQCESASLQTQVAMLEKRVEAIAEAERAAEHQRLYGPPFPPVTEPRPHRWSPWREQSPRLFWHAMREGRRVSFDEPFDYLIQPHHYRQGSPQTMLLLRCLGQGFDGVVIAAIAQGGGWKHWGADRRFVNYRLTRQLAGQAAIPVEQGNTDPHRYTADGESVAVVAMNGSDLVNWRSGNDLLKGFLLENGGQTFVNEARRLFSPDGANYTPVITLSGFSRATSFTMEFPSSAGPITLSYDSEVPMTFARYCAQTASALDVREAAIREDMAVHARLAKSGGKPAAAPAR